MPGDRRSSPLSTQTPSEKARSPLSCPFLEQPEKDLLPHNIPARGAGSVLFIAEAQEETAPKVPVCPWFAQCVLKALQEVKL